jgi:hypothetical protein
MPVRRDVLMMWMPNGIEESRKRVCFRRGHKYKQSGYSHAAINLADNKLHMAQPA